MAENLHKPFHPSFSVKSNCVYGILLLIKTDDPNMMEKLRPLINLPQYAETDSD